MVQLAEGLSRVHTNMFMVEYGKMGVKSRGTCKESRKVTTQCVKAMHITIMLKITPCMLQIILQHHACRLITYAENIRSSRSIL